MTVYNNMAFGLKLRKFKKADIDKRVQEAAEILKLKPMLERRPKALSGGQRQRVALGRAIVRKPEAFLFDEPLSNLDAKLRVEMRAEIGKLHTRLETTMIYVTHDQIEAMTMGDRIVVMKDGLIQQADEPMTIYENPANIFVAGFIGTPPMNFFSGILSKTGERLVFKEESFSLDLPARWNAKAEAFHNKAVVFGIRPEDVGSEKAMRNENMPRIKARVEVVEPMGAETYVYLDTGRHSFIARVDPHNQLKVGDDVCLPIYIEKAHLFDKATEKMIV